MLKLGKLMVGWSHHNPTQDCVKYDEYGRKWVRQISQKEFFGSICTIRVIAKLDNAILDVVEGGELIIEGKAKLHCYGKWVTDPKTGHTSFFYTPQYETFDKETGRKLSLANAISKLNLTKAEKEEIWRDYHNRV